MAGLPYVPLYVVFPRGKEAIALRVALQKPRAWSYVAEMWCGVAQFAANGRVEGPAAVHQLEDWAGWDGAPGAFVEALCLPHIGLLDVTDRGFYVHNWHIHCGLHIEKRKKDRERKKAKRSAERPRNVRGQKKDVRSNSTDELEQEKEQEQRTTQAEAAPIADLAPRPVSPLVAFLRETYPDIRDPWKNEAAWLKAYPRIDLLAEAIKARAWEVANPAKAKKHHASFLNRWYANATERLPPVVSKTHGDLGCEIHPWPSRLTQDEVRAFLVERRTVAPDLADAPLEASGPAGELSDLIAKYRAIAEERA